MNWARLHRRSNGRSAQRFRCAKLIAQYGELGGKDRRDLVSKGGMGPLGIVDVGPAGHGFAGVVDAKKQGLVQEFVGYPAVERLAVPIPHRLAGGDVVPLHLHLLRPFQDRVRGELGAVVEDDHPWLSTPFNRGCKFPRNPIASSRGIDHGCQALLGYIVDHVENAEAAAVSELILNEIDRPPGICQCLSHN